MSKILTTLILLTVTVYAQAQKSFEIGISGGFTNYYGDLGNEEFVQTTSTRPGVAVTLRNFLGKPKGSAYMYRMFNVETRLSWHRIGYDESKPIGDTKGFELRNYGRGINFRTDLVGLSTHVTYTFYHNRIKPLYMQSAAFFVFTGVGMFYGKPKADLFRGDVDINNRYYYWNDGTLRNGPQNGGEAAIVTKDGKYETDLHDWRTEGQGSKGELGKKAPYCFLHTGIPIGLGMRYGLNKKSNLSVEFGWYQLLSDYADDVSGSYATYAQIKASHPDDPAKQELAKYISDPTGYGTIGYESPLTSPRGNPAKKDSYSFINVEWSYRFDFLPKKLFSKR